MTIAIVDPSYNQPFGPWPIEINREFASHFRRPNVWNRLLRGLAGKARNFLLDPTLTEEPANSVSSSAEASA